MRHEFANSSSMEWAEYDEGTNILTIKFQSGKEYKYEDVPQEIYEGLTMAQSAGKFFQACIRGKFNVVD